MQSEAPAADGPLSVVLNARSGHNDADDVESTLSRVFAEAGRAFEIHPLDHVEAAVDAAVRDRGVVVAVGGDGTINAVAQAVLGKRCAFGVIPEGTFNYFGRTHGIPQDAEAAARALLAGSVIAAQAGLVNDRVFLVNASLGLYPQLLEDRETWKSQLGRSRLVAAMSAVATLFRERRQLRLGIHSRGATRTLRTPTLFVGNNRLQLERVGCAQAAALDHGLLAAIVVRPIGNVAMAGLALRGALGRLGEAEHVDSFVFDRIEVSPHGQRLIKVATDGETAMLAAPLVFQVAPDPLWLVAPPPELRAEIE